MNTFEQDILKRYLGEVLETTRDGLNLIGPGTIDQAWVLHIEDSLAGLDYVSQAPCGKLVDIGSGGGFPGVPLAVCTRRPTTLVDSRAKKLHAVARIAARIGIDGVETYPGRAESLAQEQPNSFAVAVARAVAELPVLLELSAPLLIEQGVLVAYKSINTQQDRELDAACSIEEVLGMKLLDCKDFKVSGILPRRIVVFKKVAPPQLDLPRRIGVAQKRPLA